MAAGHKGAFLNLFHTVWHLIARFLECETTELQDLAILRIADTILIYIEWLIDILVFFNRFIITYRRSAINNMHDGLEADKTIVQRMDERGHIIHIGGMEKHAGGRVVVINDEALDLIEGVASSPKSLNRWGVGLSMVLVRVMAVTMPSNKS